jgi:hypothetical protein
MCSQRQHPPHQSKARKTVGTRTKSGKDFSRLRPLNRLESAVAAVRSPLRNEANSPAATHNDNSVSGEIVAGPLRPAGPPADPARPEQPRANEPLRPFSRKRFSRRGLLNRWERRLAALQSAVQNEANFSAITQYVSSISDERAGRSPNANGRGAGPVRPGGRSEDCVGPEKSLANEAPYLFSSPGTERVPGALHSRIVGRVRRREAAG